MSESQAANHFVDYSLFEKVPNLDAVRIHRMSLFVSIGVTLIALNSILWSVIWWHFGYPIASVATLIFIPVAAGIYIIKLRHPPKLAFTLMLFVIAIWIFIITIGASGPGKTYGGSVHAFYLTLSALVYFTFIGQSKLEQWSYTLVFLLLFFCIELPLIDFRPYIELPIEDRAFASKVSWTNAIGTFFIFFIWIAKDVYDVEQRLNSANERKMELLESIFPPDIVKRLSIQGRTFAEHHDNCSVVFVDIVNFTALTREKKPEDLVELLNRVFGEFDDIVKRHGVEKIKTIGDAYLAVAGVPQALSDHALKAVRVAQEFISASQNVPEIELRIGIHSGAVTAGIMGKRKIIYDVWGDTVNVAMSLEQACRPGNIVISETTHQLLDYQFHTKTKLSVDAKSAGVINAFEVQ